MLKTLLQYRSIIYRHNFKNNFINTNFSLRCYRAQNENKISTPLDKVEEVNDWSTLDPEEFGNIAEKFRQKLKTDAPLRSEMNCPDDKDGYDKLEIKKGPKVSIDGYYRIMDELLTKKPLDLKEMLEVHKKFIYEDRYKPDRRFYTIMVVACARVGYTKKAIELFEEMRGFNLMPSKACVTALFNACANCKSDPKYGLEKVQYLREQFELAGFELNELQYNSLIKAFAVLGDMTASLKTMEEMISKGRQVSIQTFAMLIMGSISDKDAGMLQAIKIIRKLLSLKISPNVYIFNLLLRSVRDCQVGNIEEFKQLCASPPPPPELFNESKDKKKRKKSSTNSLPLTTSNDLNNFSNVPKVIESTSNLPNIITGENMDQIVSINFNTLKWPSNRFALIGGFYSFLEMMNKYQVQPNLKTITLLAEVLDLQDLKKLFKFIENHNIKLDICFFNVLLKRSAKKQHEQWKTMVTAKMVAAGVQPDIMTFGALTFSCRNSKQANRLLKDISKAGVKVNDQILGSLFNIACSKADLEYVNFLLKYIKTQQLAIPLKNIEQIDLLLKKMEKKIAQSERGSSNETISIEFIKYHEKVLNRFEQIMKNQKVVARLHPWSQYEVDGGTPGSKDRYHSVVQMMKKKMDIKRGRKETIVDYNDEIDD